jgi:hypothetical protein
VYPSLTVSEPADMAAAVADAIAALDRGGAPSRLASADDLVPLLALLACGRPTQVQQLLRTADADAEPRLRAAVLGRYLAWTGDIRTASALWPPVRESLDAIAAVRRPSSAELILTAGALAAAERAATDLGDPQSAGRARTAARGLDPDIAAAWPGLAGNHRILASALGLTPPAEQGCSDVAPPLEPGTLILHFAHCVLGLEPDASRHRLRLRPPARPLSVRDIPFGDGTVWLDVDAEPDGTISFRLEQDSGAIPITVLLEPVFADQPAGAEVDGAPAALVPRQTAAGVLLPVQLVLDAPRVLTVRMHEGRPPE